MKSTRICLGAGVVAVAAIVTSCGSSNSSAPTTITRTEAALTAALLPVSDLPSGYTSTPSTPSDVVPSSDNPACADLLQLFKNEAAPGSLNRAGNDYEPADQGVDSVSESLNSLGTSSKVAALLQRVNKAISGCSEVTMTDPSNQQSFTVKISPTSAPAGGTGTVAMNINIVEADFEGTQIFTGIGDTVLDMGIPTSMDVSGLFAKAVQHAQTSLNVN